MTDLRRCVKHLNRKLVSTKLFDGRLIALPLFFCLLAADSLFVISIGDLARKQNPNYINGYNQNRQRGVNEWVLENALCSCSTAVFR